MPGSRLRFWLSPNLSPEIACERIKDLTGKKNAIKHTQFVLNEQQDTTTVPITLDKIMECTTEK